MIAMMEIAQTGRTSRYRLVRTGTPKIPKIPKGWRRVTRGARHVGDKEYVYVWYPAKAWMKSRWRAVKPWDDGMPVSLGICIIRKERAR